MKLSWSIPLLFGLACLLGGCGTKSYTLQYAPKIGEAYNYKMSLSGQRDADVTMSMKPIRVEGNNVVVESRVVDMTIGGQPMPPATADLLKNLVITTTYDRQEHIISNDVSGVPSQVAAAFKSQGAGTNAAYPDKPVKVGDSWTGTVDMLGKSVEMTYKLDGVENVGGKEAAIVEGTVSSNAPFQLKAPMKMQIELATGMPISATMEAEAAGQSVKTTFTRL
ncbi:MAG TPA: DUF6263 family protein [Fimbriimonadaceae bacterium]|nr:DUF6263 family protein [Fimbriimonadaceae bacterium]